MFGKSQWCKDMHDWNGLRYEKTVRWRRCSHKHGGNKVRLDTQIVGGFRGRGAGGQQSKVVNNCLDTNPGIPPYMNLPNFEFGDLVWPSLGTFGDAGLLLLALSDRSVSIFGMITWDFCVEIVDLIVNIEVG